MEDNDVLEQIARLVSHGLSDKEIVEQVDLDPEDFVCLIRKFLTGEITPVEVE